MTATTVPWGPLAATATARFGRLPHQEKGCDCNSTATVRHACWTPTDLGLVIDVDPSTVAGWRRRGHLPIERADAVACALGRLPGDIWPEWLDWIDELADAVRVEDEAIADAIDIAQASELMVLEAAYAERRARKLAATRAADKLRRAARARERWHSDAAYRESSNQRRRSRYHDNVEVERERNNEYDRTRRTRTA